MRYLIAGPSVNICNECVGICNDVLDEEEAKRHAGEKSGPSTKQRKEYLKSLHTRDIKNNIARLHQSQDMIGSTQQLGVSVLRERKVSWAEIGEALDVSGAAARQRFGSVSASNSRSGD